MISIHMPYHPQDKLLLFKFLSVCTDKTYIWSRLTIGAQKDYGSLQQYIQVMSPSIMEGVWGFYLGFRWASYQKRVQHPVGVPKKIQYFSKNMKKELFLTHIGPVKKIYSQNLRMLGPKKHLGATWSNLKTIPGSFRTKIKSLKLYLGFHNWLQGSWEVDHSIVKSKV